MNKDEALKELSKLNIYELFSKEIHDKALSNQYKLSDYMRLFYLDDNRPGSLVPNINNELPLSASRIRKTMNRHPDLGHLDDTLYTLNASHKISIIRHWRYMSEYDSFHDASFFQVYIQLSGTSEHHYMVDNKEVSFTISENELVIVPPYLSHMVHVSDGSLLLNVLIHNDTFKSTFLSQLPEGNILYRYFTKIFFSDETRSYIWIKNNSSNIADIVITMYIESKKEDDFSYRIQENLLRILFLEVLRHNQSDVQSGMSHKESDKFAAHMILYVENNYSHITLDDVANKYHFSKTYINRIFKQHTGTTVLKYIKSLRMNEAKKLLADSDVTVAEVAHMVGYNDTSYFIEEYKKAFGHTPKA